MIFKLHQSDLPIEFRFLLPQQSFKIANRRPLLNKCMKTHNFKLSVEDNKRIRQTLQISNLSTLGIFMRCLQLLQNASSDDGLLTEFCGSYTSMCFY
jgi:hypothetical protein